MCVHVSPWACLRLLRASGVHTTPSCKLVPGNNTAGVTAWASYTESLNETGWNVLTTTTVDRSAPPSLSSFGRGFLEGYLSRYVFDDPCVGRQWQMRRRVYEAPPTLSRSRLLRSVVLLPVSSVACSRAICDSGYNDEMYAFQGNQTLVNITQAWLLDNYRYIGNMTASNGSVYWQQVMAAMACGVVGAVTSLSRTHLRPCSAGRQYRVVHGGHRSGLCGVGLG